MSSWATLPYRPCVGIMLLNKERRVLVGKRLNMTEGAWQMPQGGIDPGESPRDAAMRELEEEIGTDKAEIVAERDDWLDYDLPAHLMGKVWKGRYRGQTQKWFAMNFTGDDGDINVDTAHPEFGAWRWSSIAELIDDIVPFKVDIYSEVVSGFRHLLEARGKN